MAREEIQKMDELSRRYVENHDEEIMTELYFVGPGAFKRQTNNQIKKYLMRYLL